MILVTFKEDTQWYHFMALELVQFDNEATGASVV